METKKMDYTFEASVTGGQGSSRRGRDRWWVLVIALWAAAVLGGLVMLWRYELSPTASAEPPARWPAASAIARSAGRPTLLMSVHPKCSCSRASIAELERLLTDTRGLLDAHLLFVRPRGAPPGWEETDTWRRAKEIPGVVVHVDEAGAEAHRFGAMVSGYTLVYDASGALLFHGGITGARGHEGDNAGRARVLSLLTRGSADRPDSPTFGCDLESQSERSQRGERSDHVE
jgi:hypothetical protein